MRLTWFGKLLAAGLFVGVAAVTVAPRPAQSQDAGVIVAFLNGTLIPFFQSLLTNLVMDQVIGTGDAAVVEQLAANTVGVQQALQHHAGTMVEAITKQTSTEINEQNRRDFGTLGSVNLGSTRVNVGSNAPTACRRQNDARWLDRGGGRFEATKADVERVRETWFDGSETPRNGVQVAAIRTEDLQQYGPEVFGPAWVAKETVSEEDYQRAVRSIVYTTNPDPLPEPPAATGARSAEYRTRLEQLEERVRVPQEVLARQLALRRTIPGDPRERSYYEVLQEWGRAGLQDPNRPLALQAKTPAGVQREMALSLAALVALEAERMQSQHETNALLAILVSETLADRGKALREEYKGAVVAD